MNRHERRRVGKTEVPHTEIKLAKGVQLYQAGQLAAAGTLFRQVLRATPGHVVATRLLGEVLLDRGEFAEALLLLRHLVQVHPNLFEAQYSLGNACRLAGQVTEAVSAYRAALALQPGFAGAHHGLGLILRQMQCESEAAAEFRNATTAMPGWAIAWKDLGLTLAMLGDLIGAREAFARAVALAPGLGDAQRHLAALRNEYVDSEEIASLVASAASPQLPAGEKIEILFALGQQQDARGQYADAFSCFATANGMLRSLQAMAGFSFDRGRLRSGIDELIAAFPSPEDFSTRINWGSTSETPVFILGMPRAGSSLFEQIAASHSEVFGAGEYGGIGQIVKKLGRMPGAFWKRENIEAAANEYLAELKTKAGGSVRIIDKMPDNIFQLGLIATLFPNARVIFCSRDARDTALSCFFQHFAQPMGFDTDLDDCAFRIAEIERLMAHWRRVLPLRHMTMNYEKLLAEPEAESRRLIAFLGLQWEPACLEFHKIKRVVRTASWSQVRRPLYQNASGRWRHYAAYLPPALLAGL